MRAWLAAAAISLAALAAPAQELRESHGASAFGDLKYPADFAHFDYVNPDAPRGGAIVTTSVLANQTFDTLNGFTLRGDAPMGVAAPFNFVNDSLMASAMDEADSVYGLLASSVAYPPDRSFAVFTLRPEARFADGTPVTAADVVFSLQTLKSDAAAPRIRLALTNIESATDLGEGRVRFDFVDGAPTRDLPMVAGGLPVFSQAWYATRDFAEPSLERPMGSGPYAVGDFEPGRFIEYRRRPDYWAADLPVNVGRWNFDTIRIEYYRDRTVIPQELSAGKLDLIESFSSRGWANDFDFPAVQDGRVLKELYPDLSPPSTQGFWLNTRREHLSDPRVRQALGLAFDFEWSNRTLFYDLYVRTVSFFQNTAMQAEGPPEGAELALLEPFRDQLPAELFEAPYTPPVTDGSGRNRRQMRQAAQLLEDAGWTPGPDGMLRNSAGETLTLEAVNSAAAFERVFNPFIQALRSLGIDASFRLVDAAQEQRRQKEFDYDIIVANLPNFPTPGNSLRNYYTADAAAAQGSFNLSGVADPVVDALVEAMIGAKDREALHAAGRALDRVLRSKHLWVPNWHRPFHPIAYWDRFDRPAVKPTNFRAILDTWWVDADRDAALVR